MTRLLHIAYLLVALASVVALGILSHSINSTSQDIHAMQQQLSGYDWAIKNNLAQLAADEVALSQIEAKERNAFDAQQAYYLKSADSIDSLVANLNSTVAEVNTDVLPQATKAITHLDNTIIDIDGRSRDVFDAAAGATAQLTVDEASLQPVLTSAVETSKNLSKMSADGAAMTGDARVFVHRELAPARGAKNTIKAGLDWAYKIRQLIVP